MDVMLLSIRCLLASIFFLAGAAKLVDIKGTRQTIIGFGLWPSFAPALSVLVPLAEIAVACAMLASRAAWWGSIGAAALLATFMGAIAYNLAHGRTPDCHCFGQLHSAPADWPTLVRNGLFALL